MSGGDTWLPPGFSPPGATAVPYGHRLRPIAPGDLHRLLVADPALDADAGARMLAGRLGEGTTGTAYTYVLVDTDETAILGTVRVDPSGVSWQIVAECRGTDLARAFADVVSRWTVEHWSFVGTGS